MVASKRTLTGNTGTAKGLQVGDDTNSTTASADIRALRNEVARAHSAVDALENSLNDLIEALDTIDETQDLTA